ERRVNIYVNGDPYISLMCLPQHLEELAVGFLFAEGVIGSYGDVVDIHTEAGRGDIFVVLRNAPKGTKTSGRVLLSGFGHGSVAESFFCYEDLPMQTSLLKISPHEIVKMMSLFNERSELFRKTGAVHSASLVLPDAQTLFYEDIGRHNALDRITGKALMSGLRLENSLLLTSGRISSEMLLKTAKAGVPILISVSAPTNMAIEIAQRINMTLIGFARGAGFNVYAGEQRVR
ncbi:MAG: formate dehydrogenase accessory sulfurtransferase FdhD, partial [Defluviitaleaceae bacterium]|nr:formate dehydrogenase accessory sulfurtransferase FdhD [Defluviitaleaceae bacterium]